MSAGVEREVAEHAREAIRYNRRPKKTDRRYWELAGGVLYCGECGRRMRGHNSTSERRGKKTRRFYYICPRKFQDGSWTCPNRHHRAEELEVRIHEAVSHLFRDPYIVEEQVEQRLEKERKRDPREEIAA